MDSIESEKFSGKKGLESLIASEKSTEPDFIDTLLLARGRLAYHFERI